MIHTWIRYDVCKITHLVITCRQYITRSILCQCGYHVMHTDPFHYYQNALSGSIGRTPVLGVGGCMFAAGSHQRLLNGTSCILAFSIMGTEIGALQKRVLYPMFNRIRLAYAGEDVKSQFNTLLANQHT